MYPIPPGETIRETFGYYAMDEKEVAREIGFDEYRFEEILDGLAPIDYDLAMKLGRVTGLNPQFIMNLEYNYRDEMRKLTERLERGES